MLISYRLLPATMLGYLRRCGRYYQATRAANKERQSRSSAYKISIKPVRIAFISPISLFAGLAVIIFTKGSILFKQGRSEISGCKFIIHKLRTMMADADNFKDKFGSTEKV